MLLNRSDSDLAFSISFLFTAQNSGKLSTVKGTMCFTRQPYHTPLCSPRQRPTLLPMQCPTPTMPASHSAPQLTLLESFP